MGFLIKTALEKQKNGVQNMSNPKVDLETQISNQLDSQQAQYVANPIFVPGKMLQFELEKNAAV